MTTPWTDEEERKKQEEIAAYIEAQKGQSEPAAPVEKAPDGDVNPWSYLGVALSGIGDAYGASAGRNQNAAQGAIGIIDAERKRKQDAIKEYLSSKREGEKSAWEKEKFSKEQEQRERESQRSDERARELADIQRQSQKDLAALRLEAEKTQRAGANERDDKKQSDALANQYRDEYNNLTKDFRSVTDSFQRVSNAASVPTPAGDLAMIYNYMKMLDPGSTVREGEFAQAAATGSYGQRLKAAGERLLSGQRLTDEQRADFLAQSANAYEAQKIGYNNTRKKYLDLGKTKGIGDINFPDYSAPEKQDGGAQSKEVTRKTSDGRLAVFDAETKQFLRYAQ